MKPETKSRARQLRRDLTTSEKKLWSILRDRRFAGFKFRRQQPLGPYFADFYCAEIRLVVELDGESHIEREVHDHTRTQWLRNDGHEVIRIWKNQLYESRDAVLTYIYNECQKRARLT